LRLREGSLRRRDFIQTIGTVAVWPLAARAQLDGRVRHIGVLMNRTVDDAHGQARLAALRQALQQLGWSDGRNVRIDIRWGEDDVDRERKAALELVALVPDIVVASGTLSVAAVQNISRTLPIVFAAVADPVGAGFVDSLARPGGNATGFMIFEYGFSGKWLELLKQIAPQVTRAAVIRDPTIPGGTAQFGAIQAVAPSLGVEVAPIGVHDIGVIERAVEAFARSANGGLIMTAGSVSAVTRDLIVTLTARHKLPAVYAYRDMVTAGGLVSYGPNYVDEFRRAAGYVDRILKGAKPADLPVQAPTKYELVVNLKTARTLGIEFPVPMQLLADGVVD
jgi:putative tryptophan/tyrosine transport system substrate-binding protein